MNLIIPCKLLLSTLYFQSRRHFVITFALLQVPSLVPISTTQLFEVKRSREPPALLQDINSPFFLRRPCFWSRFAANDNPLEVRKITRQIDSLKHRIDRHTMNRSRDIHKYRYTSVSKLLVFNRNQQPDVRPTNIPILQ